MSGETFTCTTCAQTYSKGQYRGNGPVCRACDHLKSGKDLSHESMVRCPHCGYIEEAIPDSDYSAYYEEGPHEIQCGECERDYRIVTYVSFSFESPPKEASVTVAKAADSKSDTRCGHGVMVTDDEGGYPFTLPCTKPAGHRPEEEHSTT